MSINIFDIFFKSSGSLDDAALGAFVALGITAGGLELPGALDGEALVAWSLKGASLSSWGVENSILLEPSFIWGGIDIEVFGICDCCVAGIWDCVWCWGKWMFNVVFMIFLSSSGLKIGYLFVPIRFENA